MHRCPLCRWCVPDTFGWLSGAVVNLAGGSQGTLHWGPPSGMAGANAAAGHGKSRGVLCMAGLLEPKQALARRSVDALHMGGLWQDGWS